jgi:hypothetical protein
MSLDDLHWRMRRNTHEFSQGFDAELDVARQTIRARWEKSVDQGRTWEHDVNIDYVRETPSA